MSNDQIIEFSYRPRKVLVWAFTIWLLGFGIIPTLLDIHLNDSFKDSLFVIIRWMAIIVGTCMIPISILRTITKLDRITLCADHLKYPDFIRNNYRIIHYVDIVDIILQTRGLTISAVYLKLSSKRQIYIGEISFSGEPEFHRFIEELQKRVR